MFNLSATTSAVSTDSAGRPREIRAGGERLRVTSLEAIRDETSAYPVATGPRTVFVVGAAGRRFRLVYLLREHRWTVEQIGAQHRRLARAA